MVFEEQRLPGVYLVDCDVFGDERGAFARAWMPEEFSARGLETRFAQGSIATTRHRGTIRGLHWQVAPAEQVKTVRVTRGAVFDVVVDLRRDSPTFRHWVGTELSAENRRLLYVPAGVAHGYQTLADDTDVFYFASAPYSPGHEAGVRWNDPAFGVEWPLGAPTVISPRDAAYPDFRAAGRVR
jgi:dTDP-4-dehydrorhamnose 3,5-epimerase